MDLREPDRAELVDHGRMFDELAPRVAALGHHAVAVDLRGHGASGPVDTGFAWTLLHLDLALLIRHLDAGPVGFVAHSFASGQTCRYPSSPSKRLRPARRRPQPDRGSGGGLVGRLPVTGER
ncbi:MAG: alpha/beta fold hydrolase [Acidimicrobiales bacterium]